MVVTHEQQVFVEVQLISHFRLKVLDPGFDIDSLGRYSLILQTLGKIETAMIRAQDHYHGSSAGLNAIEEMPEPPVQPADLIEYLRAAVAEGVLQRVGGGKSES